MISLGDFYNVSKLLGYDFFIRGRVIHGDNIASKLGFPSANIIYPKNKIEIPFGVYYTRVKISNTDKEYDGILNYGSSFRYNINKIKTEVHIIDFSGDIYGENIQISFIAKIRNLMNFENTEKLKQQLSRDKAFAGIYGRFAFKN